MAKIGYNKKELLAFKGKLCNFMVQALEDMCLL